LKREGKFHMKKLFSLFFVFMFAIGISTPVSASGISVVVNGKKLVFDQPPIVENGRTLVPFRAIFESLGAGVTWDSKTQLIQGVRDSVKISFKLGSKNAQVNNSNITLDVPAKSLNNRTLVPLRFVGEALGATVHWESSISTVYIFDGKLTTFLKQYPSGMTKDQLLKKIDFKSHHEYGVNNEKEIIFTSSTTDVLGYTATLHFLLIDGKLRQVSIYRIFENESDLEGKVKTISTQISKEYGLSIFKNYPDIESYQYWEYSHLLIDVLSNYDEKSNGVLVGVNIEYH
jgi:Copper amine oxidase N-terminal domain